MDFTLYFDGGRVDLRNRAQRAIRHEILIYIKMKFNGLQNAIP